jgi:3-methyladenine DNA glycosylase AlkD
MEKTGEELMHELASHFRRALAQLADDQVKAGAERYFRGVITFHGVQTPKVDRIFREQLPAIRGLNHTETKELAQQMLSSSYAEEKSIAVRILHTHRKSLDCEFLTEFEPQFRKHVYDWGTADSLSGRFLRFLIERDDKIAIKKIVSWRNDSSLWMQRMAAVSFVHLARHGQVTNDVIRVCKSTIKNPERFTQLGTGWVLRELWLAEPLLVESFIEKNINHFSREGLRYAIEKMPKSLQKKILTTGKT